MNTQADSSEALAPESRGVAPADVVTRHPFQWAVRRELWEHKALYTAPLGVAAVLLVGFIVSIVKGLEMFGEVGPAQQATMLSGLHVLIGLIMMSVMSAVAWFYCLDALHGERRDRSILFWKSLPVSDLTTVLAKLSVPMVVTPVITFVASIATQLVILIIGTFVMLASGNTPAPLWTDLPLVQPTVMLASSLVVMSLWYAPLYGWLLLVSSWARRSIFLWAVLPPLTVCLLEEIAFDTNYFATLLSRHLLGGMSQTFVALKGSYSLTEAGFNSNMDSAAQLARLLDPLQFLGQPGLWAGLAVAAGFVAGAVWMRRYREPL
jgi:ABC-2 type transport system permease protein